MAAGNPCHPEPTTETTNGSRKSLSARTNNSQKQITVPGMPVEAT